MAKTSGIEIVHAWKLGTTGLAGGMVATLTRYPDNATETVATETVTIVEIGTTGTYHVSYTPTYGQTYLLDVTEATLLARTFWEDVVGEGPNTATANNAYASEADVVAYTQKTNYTSATTPTEAQVLGFLENRAALILAKLSQTIGDLAPAPAGYPEAVNIDTTTNRGKALSFACRDLNAIGAAADALMAAGAMDSPNRGERVTELLALWELKLHGDNGANRGIAQVAQQYATLTSLVETNVSAGESTEPTVLSTEGGLEFDLETLL